MYLRNPRLRCSRHYIYNLYICYESSSAGAVIVKWTRTWLPADKSKQFRTFGSHGWRYFCSLAGIMLIGTFFYSSFFRRRKRRLPYQDKDDAAAEPRMSSSQALPSAVAAAGATRLRIGVPSWPIKDRISGLTACYRPQPHPYGSGPLGRAICP